MSIAYMRAHSLHCTFCGLWQLYNEELPLSCYPEEFHCPKNPLCSIYSSLSPPESLTTTDPFTVSTVLPFPKYHIVGIIDDLVFSDWPANEILSQILISFKIHLILHNNKSFGERVFESPLLWKLFLKQTLYHYQTRKNSITCCN